MSARIVHTDYTKKTRWMRGLFPLPKKKCRDRAAIDNPAEMGYSKGKGFVRTFRTDNQTETAMEEES